MLRSYALVIFMILVGCKPFGQSKTQSLDNFAGGDAKHYCKGNYPNRDDYVSKYDLSEVRNGDQAAITSAISDALTALPLRLKDRFFNLQGSKIVVSDQVAAKCAGTSLAAAYEGHDGDNLFSCHSGRTDLKLHHFCRFVGDRCTTLIANLKVLHMNLS